MPITDMDGIKPLSEAIAVHRSNYDSGDTDYSVTTLLDPPRVVHLNKRHLSKCDIFVKEQLASFIGTAIHNYFEYCLGKSTAAPYKMEERLFATILNRKVSGCYDLVREEDLEEDMYDYKTTSCWKARFGDKKDWTAQQNIYRYLYWLKYKKQLRSIRIVAIFLDWSINNKMRYGKGYPDEKSLEYNLPRWTSKQTIAFLEERVSLMKQYEETPDDDLPECTWDDMWCKPDKCAVKCTTLKNALRICDSTEAAKQWIADYLVSKNCKHPEKNLYLDERPTVRTRCEHWCPCNKYCNQFQSYIKAKA
jgi:hypothetical protein